MTDYDKENRSNEGSREHYRNDNYKEDHRHSRTHHGGNAPPRYDERHERGDHSRRSDYGRDYGRSRDGYDRRDRDHYSDYHHDDRHRRDNDREYQRRRSRSRSRERQPHRGDERGDPKRPLTKHHPPKKNDWPEYRVTQQAPDARLGDARDDPRGNDPTQRITKKAQHCGHGRNTESFDPASTLVRPDLRIHVGSSQSQTFHRTLKHDDVVIVPELFGPEDNWDTYYQLIEEMREIQSRDANNNGDTKTKKKSAEWVSWAEGAHLLTKHPEESPTFNKIIDRLCEYFNIQKQSIGTRFNWYRDSADWKPFHHDSAAFNPQRARTQNITVGASFGSLRELAFLHATPQTDGDKTRIYFPQANNGVFSFGRDANIVWKHGINALAPDDQDGKGRISIILWGLAQGVVEEEGSPPLLGSDGRGPHAGGGGRGRNNHHNRHNRDGRNHHHNNRNGGRNRR